MPRPVPKPYVQTKPKCRLDWDPYAANPHVPKDLRLGLALYGIYLWSNGDGSDLIEYTEKRAVGTLLRIRSVSRRFTCFDAPSQLELVRMSQSKDECVREDALEVLSGNLCNEAIAILLIAWKRWKLAGARNFMG